MKNTKKIRFLIGSTLAVVFSVYFLLFGIGSFFVSSYLLPKAQADLVDKNITNGFKYETDTLNNLRKLDLKSYLGKPVKIPFSSENKEGIPGADQDYLIIFPPRVLDKNVSVPVRAMYLSSGKELKAENVELVKNVDKFVNSIGNNNPVLLEIIKNLIESDLKISIKDSDSLLGIIQAKFLGFQSPLSLLRIPTTSADTTTDTSDSSPLLTSDDISQLTDSIGEMDTSDPQVKQLLVLVLLLIMMNQSLADSLNSDKQACLDMGGEWANNTCSSEQKTVCEDNGGIYKKFNSQCLADKQVCDSEDTDCSEDNSNDYLDNTNDNADNSVYACGCKSGECLSSDGVCISKNNTQKKACESSGGTWRSFYDVSDLCAQGCDTEAQNACTSKADDSNSSTLMGCDCSSATGVADKWAQSNTNSAGTCLATSGKCIAKDNSNGDDDNDGVKNSLDRCPNSTPDGSGTVNMQAGSQYMGCTCSQIQALGGIQNNKVQCPPDGCESGTPYMVKYDRSQQNTNSTLCQNGIVTQPNTNSSCPVISREPTDQCEREMERKNQNKNDNLNDLLKKLLDDKKKKDQDKKNQGDKGNNQGNNTNPGQQQQQQQQQNLNTNVAPKVAMSAAIDPKGPGEYNAKQNGSVNQPYALHASQFKKVCGENTYMLTNATPGEGKFKNDPSKANTVTPGNIPINNLSSALNQLSTCSGSTCPTNKNDIQHNAGQAYNQIKDKFVKLDQSQQQSIINILNGSGDANSKINQAVTATNQAYNNNQQKAQTPAPSTGKEAASMQDLKEPGAYFKVPTCQELAKTHCCICSCCDKKDEQCGWTVGEKCDEKGEKGECKGDKCSKAGEQCGEKPQLSIKINWGSKFNECSNDGSKEKTSEEKCKNYTKATHNEGACRYDCTGSTKGCEEGSADCKIIINGREIQRFNDQRWPTLQIAPDPEAQYTEFQNKKEGSSVQSLGEKQPAENDWIKGLEKEKGQACKCQDRDKSKQNPSDKPDGFVHPNGTQPQNSGSNQNQYDNWDEGVVTPNGTVDANSMQGQGIKPAANSPAAHSLSPTTPDQQFPSNLNPAQPPTDSGTGVSNNGLPGSPDRWEHPVTDSGQYVAPTAPSTSGTNSAAPAAEQTQPGIWESFANFFRAIWNWGSTKNGE